MGGMQMDDFYGSVRDTSSVARMYDYFLGGSHNFEVDRLAAETIIAINPDTPLVAHANRAFLRRVINVLAARGVAQFLDIGSGIPTVGNVHEVVQRANPGSRVVYVDNDPVAVAHSQSILTGNPNAVVIEADARQPEQILEHCDVRRMLNLDAPLAVLLMSLLHFVPDDEEAHRLVRVLRDTLAPGSYIALSHAVDEVLPRAIVEQGEDVYSRSSNPGKYRSRAQIATFFDGLTMLDPGLVYIPLWHPERADDVFRDQPERSLLLGGIGQKP